MLVTARGPHSESGTATNKLRFDHAIPFKYLELGLLRLKKVTPKAVRRLQLRYDIYVIITTSEDEQLDARVSIRCRRGGMALPCWLATKRSGSSWFAIKPGHLRVPGYFFVAL